MNRLNVVWTKGPSGHWGSKLLLGVAMVALTGCADISHRLVSHDEAPIVQGPRVRPDLTPMEPAFACMADQIAATRRPIMTIGVGEIKDYTGKYNINEGNAITQGGALMVYSALGKLDGTVGVAERFDTRIADLELAYTDRRQLGDSQAHDIKTQNKDQKVPWIPYYGGSVFRSDYYIVGGITELNYNIQSGGAQATWDLVGPQARVYTENVAIDLRIVDTRSLLVVKTVSIEKQLTGYEVDLGIFRFFGSDLFDLWAGAKSQEPLQLGVRTALEEGVVELISAVEHVPYQPCLNYDIARISDQAAWQMRKKPVPGGRLLTVHRDAALDGLVSEAPPTQILGGGSGGVSGSQIAFEFASTELPASAQGALDKIALIAKKTPVEIMLVASVKENWDSTKRESLTTQRVSAITSALQARGIAPAAVQVVWKPSSSDNSIHQDGAGYQEIAKLRVGG